MALVLKHTYTGVDIFMEQGQVACSKGPRGKKTSDVFEIIKKHKLYNWSVKRRNDPGNRLPLNNTNFFHFLLKCSYWVERKLI